MTLALPDDHTARARVAIEGVAPQIDGGRFAITRISGEEFEIAVDAFAEGHDHVACQLEICPPGESEWTTQVMDPQGNDRFGTRVRFEALGIWRYRMRAYIDYFSTWQDGLARNADAGNDVEIDLEIGARLIDACIPRAEVNDARRLSAWAVQLRDASVPLSTRIADARAGELKACMARYPDLRFATVSANEYPIRVEHPRAQFSSWYELFPRSTSPVAGRHGTLIDVIAQLDRIAEMGFDVLYLPPIHPIGRIARKGPNNAPTSGPEDVGSPWAIGANEGGHDAIHPDLGTIDDLRTLHQAARGKGIELALDLALQCAPDHPWVTNHPEWFRSRPDGSIQYAENPPKRYQDIYPLDFECDAWRALWTAIAEVVEYWVDHGIRIFRVDNPHTKPFAFWEWLIARIHTRTPEVVFLAEAFTRPKIMRRLAKLGFTQSYTYFAWRNTADELIAYLTELTTSEMQDYFRPNFWPNTPDILTAPLQGGDPAVFATRLVLAATLSASYGIYGPAYELYAHTPIEVGSEEYRDSEKYEIRHWDLTRPDRLDGLITRINMIRHAHPALQQHRNVVFLATDDPKVLAYRKATNDGSDVVVVIVNLDPTAPRQVHLDLDANDIAPARWENLLTGDALTTHNGSATIRLDSVQTPCALYARIPSDPTPRTPTA